MSNSYYGIAGLRFWSQDEIELREAFQSRIASVITRELLAINAAFRVMRVEAPIITERSLMASYDNSDVFNIDWSKSSKSWALRAETTASSYAVARRVQGKLPICIWQAGKSFRKEENDGASASKLRFNEFWQQEFQIIYRNDTKEDYRAKLMPHVEREISRATGLPARIIESDRLPLYSQSTLDIEVLLNNGTWREIASCSIRNDYSSDALVCEIAIGLCRVASLAGYDF